MPESAVLRKFRDSGPPVMQRAAQLEANAARKYSAPTTSVRSVPLAVRNNPRLFGEVFGFAFASSLGDPTIGYPSWNFGLLSTVAYFGIHVDWTGDFSGGSALNTWNDPYGPVPGFISTAHASGTKVVLTIAMFDSTSGTPDMCSALQRSDVTIRRTVAEINAKGIDGVNVDYESNNTTCVDPGSGIVASSQSLFTTFVKNLRAALPGSYISVDTYSGSAGYRDCSTCPFLGFFDIGALANYADSFFVMAYDMEYANWDSPPLSCPSFCIGPTAPLSTYLFNDGRASAEYRAVVAPSKILMGIPYYGRKECVAIPDPTLIPANAMGTSVGADGYLDASTEQGYPGNTIYTIHRETRDPLSGTRWDTFSSVGAGCNREMYWDDATALGNKYNLIIRDHLRGAGIFALNYGGGAPELWNLINLKFGQCSEAAIVADHTIPQIPGTSITFGGTALCAGTGTFRFSIQPPGGAFAVMRDYSPVSTWSWDTTGQPLGTYTVRVDAKNQGASPAAGFDTQAQTSFRLALCVTPTMTTDLAAPQLPGTAITVTSNVTCRGTPEYSYWVLPPGGGAWTMARASPPSATFRWDTTGLSYGDWRISVHVRTVGTTVVYESNEGIPYPLRSCISAALTTDKASPQPTGTQIALSGTATCVGTPQFQFMIQPPGGTLSVVQSFGTSSTFTWIAGGPSGTYILELDAKGAAASPSTMASTQVQYNLKSCTSVTLAANPGSPQIPGTAVLLTGSATCPGTAQYRFLVRNPIGSVTILQGYGSANTYSWNSTGLPVGGYGLTVDARNVGATAASEVSAGVIYTLSNAACTAPTLSSDLASPQGAGSVITFSATTTTCPSPLYRFNVEIPNVGWTLMQDYGPSSTFKWHATGPGGNYRVDVDVRDSTRTVAYDQQTIVPFVIKACTAATLSLNVPSPQASGTQVIFTSVASGCPNPVYQFWILAPGSTWTIVQPYSSAATLNWNTAGLLAGTYYYTVWVRDASSSGTSCDSFGCKDALFPGTAYVLTSSACTSVTASASPASSQPSGTAVSFTGVASPCPKPLYQFWILAPGGAWQIVQAYSSSATFNWNTTGLPAGTYYYTVWARDSGSAGTSCNSFGCKDALFPGTAYVLTSAPCTSVTASASPVSPQGSGTVVTFTGVASGCAHPLYQFWIVAPESTWQIVQAYSSAATFNWSTTGLPAGTYYYTVWARDSGSAGTSCNNFGCKDALFPGTAYALTATSCTSITASATPASPQASGTAVTFAAVASGCPNPRYEFWTLAPGSTWQIVQAYSSNASFNWSTTGLLAGTYYYTVWVRDAGSTGTSCNSFGCKDALFPGTAYMLTSTPCASVTVSATPAPPQLSGTAITFTAVASGCPHPLYQFWIVASGSSWQIVQAYSTIATYSWNTAGLPPGTYYYTVWVRDSGSAGTSCNNFGCKDALLPGTTYSLDTPCTSMTASASPASPQASGTAVTFSASAAGCAHPLYQFWILAPGGTWQIVQAYSTTATFTWTTTGVPAGTYLYTVWARDSASAGTSCNVYGCKDALFPGTAYTLN